jgi:cytochrome c-type biogenesis protein CcmH/NrfG
MVVFLAFGIGFALGYIASSQRAERPVPQRAERPAPPRAEPPARAGGPAQTEPSPENREKIARLNAQLASDPRDVKSRLELGHLYLDQRQHSDAMQSYRAVLTIQPDNPEALTHMGVLLYESGQVEAALAHIDRALAINPRYAHALWDKGRILLHGKQDTAGAVKAWERFLAVSPTGTDAEKVRRFLSALKNKE